MRATVRASESERWEETLQSLSQHRLTRAGRPDHEEVVAPRRGNLEGPTAEGLAPHVRQVGRGGGAEHGCWRRRRHGGPAGLAAEDGHEFAQRGRASYLAPRTSAASRTSQSGTTKPRGRRRVGQGDHAGDVTQRAVQPELPTEGETLGAARTQLAGGDKEAHRDREVEAGAALADTGGRKVDTDPSQRPGQPAGQDGGAYPVVCLAYRASGNPTMVNPGRPFETWTSTETELPAAPVSVADAMAACCSGGTVACPLGGTYRNRATGAASATAA